MYNCSVKYITIAIVTRNLSDVFSKIILENKDFRASQHLLRFKSLQHLRAEISAVNRIAIPLGAADDQLIVITCYGESRPTLTYAHVPDLPLCVFLMNAPRHIF